MYDDAAASRPREPGTLDTAATVLLWTAQVGIGLVGYFVNAMTGVNLKACENPTCSPGYVDLGVAITAGSTILLAIAVPLIHRARRRRGRGGAALGLLAVVAQLVLVFVGGWIVGAAGPGPAPATYGAASVGGWA